MCDDQDLAWPYVEALTKILLPFLVGITTIDSMARLKQLAWVIVLSQGYVAYELNMAYFGGFNRVWEIGFGGMDNNCVAVSMDSCIGLAFFLGLSAERWWQKGLALVCALLMAHVVLLSFSRGGMLALILMTAVAFLLIPKTAKHYAIFLVVVLVGVRLAGAEVQARFMTVFAKDEERDFSAKSREELWRDCLDCTARHPVFGVGPNNWGQVAPQYGWPLGKEAHTLWLQLAAEMGVPGLLFLVLFYGLCVARLWRYTRQATPVPDPWVRHFARMVIASIVGFVVSAQFVNLPGLEAPYYIVLVGASALKLAGLPADAVPAEEAPADADGAAEAPAPVLAGSRSSFLPN
jgi:O-antigen ligase